MAHLAEKITEYVEAKVHKVNTEKHVQDVEKRLHMFLMFAGDIPVRDLEVIARGTFSNSLFGYLQRGPKWGLRRIEKRSSA